MKKDLLIAGALILLAALGIGLVVLAPMLQSEPAAPKTMKPRPEPIAALPKKEEPKKEPTRLPPPAKKKIEPAPKIEPEAPKVVAKIEPELPKKIERPAEPPKVEAPAEKKPMAAKIIALGNLIKLNDPDGDYTVSPLQGGRDLVLIGRIKTLQVGPVNERSGLDASELVAQDIVFTGNINDGSRVKLGKAVSLKILDVNSQSIIDGSALDASRVQIAGNINGGSTLKLHAPGGMVEMLGEVNAGSHIDISAPAGKVLFQSRNDAIINGASKLTVLAKDVELLGTVNGMKTVLDVTLTRAGSLKFRRLNGGVRLDYRKADASDPEPRIEAGEVNARAEFHKGTAPRKR